MSALAVLPAVAPSRPTLAVDLGAVAANVRTFAALNPLLAVVKADGFGHGAADVARTALAHGATGLGVTSIDEAFALRDHGIDAPVLSWLNPVDADWEGAAGAGVEVAVPSLEHLLAQPPGARVHLHLDVDMARDGAAPAEWLALCGAARRLERAGALEVVGLMGHLGCADEPDHPANATARTRFAWGLETARAAGLRPRVRHLAATSATLTDPRTHHTLSRVGAGLVGIDPSRTTALRPALTLTAPLVTLREVRPGTPVGYGHTWVADRRTTLGLLPVGYADGLPRLASGRGEVWVSGRRRPLVGRISMDMAVVDLGDTPARPGDPVTVFGPGDAGEPTVREWADWADTIEHEVATGLGSRLHRTTVATPLRSLA
ncbi:alanine racemase [Nocardioides sp. SYSU D00038]|uniref:alanine racemase n=1 Tax=Nocardioides sp. SYSU D00038 TaxID=2812554 RepID=UPI00196871AA|nr:alanine racemase [Nocardioides sp. SYSU D00038]